VVKGDARFVKSSLTGKGCGALAVGIGSEQNQEISNTKQNCEPGGELKFLNLL
jgi:hypothetical protein